MKMKTEAPTFSGKAASIRSGREEANDVIKLAYKIMDENATYFRCDRCGEVLYRIIGEPLGGRPDVTFGGNAKEIKGASTWRYCPHCGKPFYTED